MLSAHLLNPGVWVLPEKLNRLHGLDTLRALAIVSVMIFHLQASLPGALDPIGRVGWMGVDLFFVLSGFLIGTQLLQPLAAARPLLLLDFYVRRGFRVLPASFAVLLLYMCVPAWREQPNLPAVWKFLTFTQNLCMHFPHERAFSHAWSLCVEEQFYLLLPPLVLLCRRWLCGIRKTILLLGAVLLLGVLVRGWELFHVVRSAGLSDNQAGALFMKRIYYPTYSRLDGLWMGVAVALVRCFRPGWWAHAARSHSLANVLGAAGLCIAGVATWSFGAEYPSADQAAGVLFGFPLLSLGLALLVSSAASGKGLLCKRLPGMQMVATLAFSLYLTHKEVAHLDQWMWPWLRTQNGWGAAAVYAVTCAGCATALYWLVERPFLLLRVRLTSGPASPAGLRQTRRSIETEARLDPAL
ncbi:acyltransferase [Acidipila sp. EB88]|nr:acyltransferase [Acidipila sp. EB88]